ncbi:MAG: iron-containing alcohol dehydrogenase [Solirubrobacterales bacterium]|nr:iron-containing alcohol dehydrogenase [Solirubrobacterales bacterium]
MDGSLLPAFANHLPVRIRFGSGVAVELSAVLARLGARRPAVFVDPALAGTPVIAALMPSAAVVLQVVPGEPTVRSVDDAGERLRDAVADAVVAIGGGSVLDTAKGARLVAEQGPIRRFAWPGEPEPIAPLRLPLVTLPTTAGTGSEVTGGIVMADPEAGIKVAAPSAHNRATDCLVDPDLTLSLPAGPTLWGGLDVVAQAIGSIVSAPHTPVADAIALEALVIVRDALPAVVNVPGDRGARSRLACASLMAGLAMNLSEAGTDHSLGHAVGMRLGVPHGLSVGVMLAASMEHDRRYVPERFERVADALGAPPDDGSSDGSRAVRAVREMFAAIGVPSLRDLGAGEDDIAGLADGALAAWIPVEPGPWAREDVETAFRRALDEGVTSGAAA